ncbi:hypothetical protein ACFELO_09300 [Oceanicaulis sp. LC35]|uniref:hypothetical protein n=1 Tax=Oceanicaulis sp. LC35 TaxID=3349635 RepID=UPI003F87C1A3
MKRLLSAAAAMIVLGSGAALAQPMGFDGYGARGHGHHDRGQGRGHGGMNGLRMLQVADLNGDNTVTRAEVEQLQGEEFAYRDRNGDGFLDEADASPMHIRMMSLREERREARQAEREDRPNRREGRGDGRRGQGRGFDADQDGRISSDEFMAGSLRMFERLDANSDGSVTPDELDAHVAAREERREERRTPWWRN